MHPSKSVMDMKLSSLRKKFKDKRFAAGCSRDIIRQGAEALGWELDDLFSQTIEAMKSCEACPRGTLTGFPVNPQDRYCFPTISIIPSSLRFFQEKPCPR